MIKPFKPAYDKKYHIGAWIINHKVCDDLVNYLKVNEKLLSEGNVGKGEYKKGVKESKELHIHSLRFDHPWGAYRHELQYCLEDYIKQYPEVGSLKRFNVIENYNLQFYKPGAGFKLFHYERNGFDLRNTKRCLVFMTYLWDVKDAGTEFKYQKITTPCKKGLTLIWPADWTHTHKGQINKKKEKAIVTGWYSYLFEGAKDFVHIE
jgi:prolyl 4-hydroxylase